jgi:hypothetical protein
VAGEGGAELFRWIHTNERGVRGTDRLCVPQQRFKRFGWLTDVDTALKLQGWPEEGVTVGDGGRDGGRCVREEEEQF